MLLKTRTKSSKLSILSQSLPKLAQAFSRDLSHLLDVQHSKYATDPHGSYAIAVGAASTFDFIGFDPNP